MMRPVRIVSLYVVVFLLLVGSCVLLHPRSCSAQEIPCVEKKGTKWRLSKDKTCIQHTREKQIQYNNALKQLKYYKQTYEPVCEQTKQDCKKLDEAWKKTEAVWAAKQKLYQKIIEGHEKNEKAWKDAFWKLHKQRIPTKHWTQSPVLWYSMGSLTIIGLGGMGVGIYMGSASNPMYPYVLVGSGILTLVGIGFGLYAVLVPKP